MGLRSAIIVALGACLALGRLAACSNDRFASEDAGGPEGAAQGDGASDAGGDADSLDAAESGPACPMPDGGLPCDPGAVWCDGSACAAPNICCSTSSCAPALACTLVDSLSEACDESADCDAGMVCCMTGLSKAGIESSCKAAGTCPDGAFPPVILCRSTSACPTCALRTCDGGIRYESCSAWSPCP